MAPLDADNSENVPSNSRMEIIMKTRDENGFPEILSNGSVPSATTAPSTQVSRAQSQVGGVSSYSQSAPSVAQTPHCRDCERATANSKFIDPPSKMSICMKTRTHDGYEEVLSNGNATSSVDSSASGQR